MPIFLFNIDLIFDLQPNFRRNTFCCIFDPFLKVLALGTVTVGFALKNHVERSGREIQGSHGEPFRAIFCFQLRPPISGEPFFEPAPQFRSLPPLCPPNIQSNTKINLSMSPKNDQTAADIHRFFESMSTTSIFCLQKINFIPARQGG